MMINLSDSHLKSFETVVKLGQKRADDVINIQAPRPWKLYPPPIQEILNIVNDLIQGVS